MKLIKPDENYKNQISEYRQEKNFNNMKKDFER